MRIPYLWLPVLPYAIWGIGALLNVLVVSVNGGMMPVVVPNYQWIEQATSGAPLLPGMIIDVKHVVMQHSDHLKFLADWIQIPGLGTASIGDGFLAVGDAIQSYCIGAWLALLWKKHDTRTSH